MTTARKKLIEVALPLDDINKACVREKSIRHGHPSTLHLWWARRPLAAARAVLFSQMVDDPSSNPDLQGDEVQLERERLFDIIKDLIQWKNSDNQDVLNSAREEILKSWRRNCEETGDDPSTLPPFFDPFAGGGAIPLEAQRLGFNVISSDLNPIAVLINRAMVEIPPQVAGLPPVNPESEKALPELYADLSGLSEDVLYYGEWMRKEAFSKVGHLYPEVELPEEYGGGHTAVIAWLWTRTVPCPNPSCQCELPLVRSFELSSKKGKRAWVRTSVDQSQSPPRVEFDVEMGEVIGPKGTVNRRGGTCLACHSPVPFTHIRTEGQAGRMGVRLMAMVAKSKGTRVFLPPTLEMEILAESITPEWGPDFDLPENPRDFKTPKYGMRTFADLFCKRQLVGLTTYAELVQEAREKAFLDAKAAGMEEGESSVISGQLGADEYANIVALYLGLGVSRLADIQNAFCGWEKSKTQVRHLFTKHAIPMLWDFGENNMFNDAAGDFRTSLKSLVKTLAKLPANGKGKSVQANAMVPSELSSAIHSTDPPYYDNIGYADLSDFFYVWLRKSIQAYFPVELSTVLVPKAEELIAAPYRHDGAQSAEQFFLKGMTKAMSNLRESAHSNYPITIYYAFKQSEKSEDGVSSSGWAVFLQAVLDAGLSVLGTWPMWTESKKRPIGVGKNALASSVILVCGKGAENSAVTTRSDFVRLLKKELPPAIDTLKLANIAPVDLAQAAIGPGMGVFSRYGQVLENDGSSMAVQSALQLINKVLDEYLTSTEGDYDDWTGFAVPWFEQHGMGKGDFGLADNLSRARGVSVDGVVEAGIADKGGGKVWLINRDELDANWNPATDNRLTVWESLQHLIRRLNGEGEEAAARLLKRLGGIGREARNLAYRLFTICENQGWAEEGVAYNHIIVAWPGLDELSQGLHVDEILEQKTFDN